MCGLDKIAVITTSVAIAVAMTTPINSACVMTYTLFGRQ
jgi:hypothetical protein